MANMWHGSMAAAWKGRHYLSCVFGCLTWAVNWLPKAGMAAAISKHVWVSKHKLCPCAVSGRSLVCLNTCGNSEEGRRSSSPTTR